MDERDTLPPPEPLPTIPCPPPAADETGQTFALDAPEFDEP